MNKKKKFFVTLTFFFIFYISTIILINYIYFLNYVKKWPEIILQNGDIDILKLPFSFDQVTFNLINGNGLLNKDYYFGTSQYLSRMPLIPIIIKFIYLNITKKFFFIILIKNLFFFINILVILYLIFRNHIYTLLSFGLIIYNFHNVVTLTSLVPEEGFLGYLIIILFLLLHIKYKNNYLLISFVISIIFFTKSSMVFLCYATSLVISYLEYKIKNKKFFFPVLIIFLSYLIWSCYGYTKLGKFLNPFSLSSISGQTINIAYNEEFNKIYPEQSADILENYIFSKINKSGIKNINEFEINEIFIKNSLEFIKGNPKEVFFSYLQKIYNIFLNLKYDGKEKLDNEYNKIRYSNIPNKIFLNLMILIIIKNLITKTYKYKDFLCLTIILGYLFPYIIGFAYSRQMVPLYILAHFYVFFHIIQKCQIKKNY